MKYTLDTHAAFPSGPRAGSREGAFLGPLWEVNTKGAIPVGSLPPCSLALGKGGLYIWLEL